MGRKKSTEPKQETEAQQEPAEQQPEAQPDPHPFLKTPAEQGGIIIGLTERDGTTPLTPVDIDAAHEELYLTSQELREAEVKQRELVIQEKQNEAALKGTREQLRKAELKQLELGRDLATLSEEIHTGERKVTIKVVKTITLGNELVLTDARDGREIERRTATTEELEQSRQPGTNQAAMRYGTSDSPDAKQNPDDQDVTVSVRSAAYKKTKRGIAEGLMEVPYPNAETEEDGFGVAWSPPADGRSSAIVPRWVAHRLAVVAEGDKALDFRIEEAKPEGAAPAAPAEPAPAGNVVQVEFGQKS